MILEFFIIKDRIARLFSLIPQNGNENVLDLGCGNAPYYHMHIKGKLVCFDVIKTKKVDIVGDAGYLPFKANFFDKVVSVNSFYYFKNPFNVIGDVSRILKKNGKLILVVPFFYPIHDIPVDKYRFTEYGLRNILEKKFKIEKLQAIGGIFTLPSVICHSAMKGVPHWLPERMRKLSKIAAYALFPLYVLSQFLSIFDFIDKTKRVPTYYFVIASKK